jgi:hypothetical protein
MKGGLPHTVAGPRRSFTGFPVMPYYRAPKTVKTSTPISIEGALPGQGFGEKGQPHRWLRFASAHDLLTGKSVKMKRSANQCPFVKFSRSSPEEKRGELQKCSYLFGFFTSEGAAYELLRSTSERAVWRSHDANRSSALEHDK